MALVFLDGLQLWDNSTRSTLLNKWTSIDSINSAATTSNGRWGSGSGAINFGSNSGMTRTFTTAITNTVISGAAFQLAGNSFITALSSTGSRVMQHVGLNIDIRHSSTTQGSATVPALVVYNNATSTTLATIPVPQSVWFYLEFKQVISATVGSVEVRVDGHNRYSTTAINTGTSCTGFRLQNNNNSSTWFTDIYVCDGSGSTNTDFLGDIRVETLYPSAEGNYTNFTLGTGGSKTAAVSERLYDSDNSYVYSNTLNHAQTYAMSDLATASGSVHGVRTQAVARKETSPPRGYKGRTRVSSTDSDGSEVTLPDTFAYVVVERYQDTKPGGGAWAISDVNAMETGVLIST